MELAVSEKRRAILCLLSVLLAYGLAAVSGAWVPAAKLLHQSSLGVLVAFLLVFMISMFLTLRRGLVKSVSAIPISAALAYPAATLAYTGYFMAFEPQRILNSLARSPLTDVIMALLFVGPTGSFAWLFGGMAGAAFFLLALRLGTTRPRFE